MHQRLRQAFEEDDTIFTATIVGLGVLSTAAMLGALFLW